MKVGDKVRALESCDAISGKPGIVKGVVYTVERLDGSMVRVREVYGAWFAARFELVVPAPAVAVAPKVKPSLIPADALLAVAGLLTTAGAGKHADEKWKTMTVQEHLDAAMRHLLKRGAGETVDPEFGHDHATHATARLLFAVSLLVSR